MRQNKFFADLLKSKSWKRKLFSFIDKKKAAGVKVTPVIIFSSEIKVTCKVITQQSKERHSGELKRAFLIRIPWQRERENKIIALKVARIYFPRFCVACHWKIMMLIKPVNYTPVKTITKLFSRLILS